MLRQHLISPDMLVDNCNSKQRLRTDVRRSYRLVAAGFDCSVLCNASYRFSLRIFFAGSAFLAMARRRAADFGGSAGALRDDRGRATVGFGRHTGGPAIRRRCWGS